MKKLLMAVTDRVATKKGMITTLSIWLAVIIVLSILAPNYKDYEVTSIDSLPETAQSVIAQQKIDQYFDDNEGTPAIFVFQSKEKELTVDQLKQILSKIEEKKYQGVSSAVPFQHLPPAAFTAFFSEDRTTAIIPYLFDSSMESKEMKEGKEQIVQMVEQSFPVQVYVTGPVGIAADSIDLFSRADLVLLFSTIGLILVLLILIYRSPLLALIPLIAAVFVYGVVIQVLGIMGKAGVTLSNQTISIMSILLFATVIDYSLFVFSRFREELKNYEDKYVAMREAMRGTGMPVFFSGGTVLAAMLVLFFAQLGDYQNFAPTFSVTMAIVMMASITLIPALFVLFGRKSFWPKVPKVGEEKTKSNSFWNRVGRLVVNRPGLCAGIIGVFLLVSASNLIHLKYEFDTMKSFPEDMPSRVGYEVLEEKFEKGVLAPTTVLFESSNPITGEQQEKLKEQLSKQPLVSSVNVNGVAEGEKAVQYQLSWKESPYDLRSIDALEQMLNNADQIVRDSGLSGKLYFAGETSSLVDVRQVNNEDILLIVCLEIVLIFAILLLLSRSVKISIYMIGTILISYLAALGLGMFLTDLLFGIDSISDRVPLYSFVFLVALGIDYNIMLMSRYQEEREKHPVKEAIQIAVANTGGVISSAGLILAATFAVLMTQPLQLLFVFGFIVAVGILLDTFIIRGVLLPSLVVLFEKGPKKKLETAQESSGK